ncbi:transport protein [Loigolactobacillus rennini DSM 20253]|uniref:Transport protein n=1 Tax=Loigolactobacillus rennini DSM 20253 TaxID=1423796 RepID=A0A0R2DGM7_9LACO|nr:transport protein [Loigolactobacillus rennini DSM 20253]
MIPLLLVSLILGIYAIQQAAPTVKTSFDFVSWLLIILLFTGFTLAFSHLAQIIQYPLRFCGWLLIGLIGLFGFIWRTKVSPQPLIKLTVFHNRSFNYHLIAFFLIQLCVLGLAFILPNYIQLVNGQSALLAGLFVLPGAALGAIFAPLGGRILDRYGAAKPILTGASILTVALFLFVILGMRLTGLLILLIYLLLMIGTGLTMGNTMTSGLNQLTLAQQADGNALFNTLQQFAGAVGTSLVSALITLVQVQASGSAARKIALGATVAFGLLFVFMLLNLIVISMAMKRRQ